MQRHWSAVRKYPSVCCCDRISHLLHNLCAASFRPGAKQRGGLHVCVWTSDIGVCLLVACMQTILWWPGVSKWMDCWGMRCQRVEWRAAVLILRSSRLFWSKHSSVTQEFKLCFYSLSYYASNHLRHSVLSLSLFATLKQTKKTSAVQREAKSAPFLTPQTCSLRHWSAVSCACAVFNIPSMWFHLFCNLNCSSGIRLKMNLCTTLQVFFNALQTHNAPPASLQVSHFLTPEIGRDLLFSCR